MLGVWGRRVLVVTVEVDISVCLAALFPMTIGLTEEVFLKLHFISLMQSLRSIISPKKTSRKRNHYLVFSLSFHSDAFHRVLLWLLHGCCGYVPTAVKDCTQKWITILFAYFFLLLFPSESKLNWAELSFLLNLQEMYIFFRS